MASGSSAADRNAETPDWREGELLDGRPRGSVVEVDPIRGTMTFALPGDDAAEPALEPVLARVSATSTAATVVEREARLLVELRRLRLGPIEKSIPRHAGTRRVEGMLVALSSTMPGHPMCAERPLWPIGAHPAQDRHNFRCAAEWLSALQTASATGRARVDWPDQVIERVRERWSGHPQLGSALSRLEPSAARLGELVACRTVVHGDFWHGNVLVDEHRITGVMNWYDGETAGSPLRDLARFALRYAHHEHRHVLPRHVVVGRASLRPTARVPGQRFDLLGRGWFPRIVRTFLQQGLERLGLPADRWYATALVGLGELAARELDPVVAETHLILLASLTGGQVAATGSCV